MGTDQPPDMIRHLRRAALARDGGGLTDAQLLECFITDRDAAAFEALVRRHGRMVLGVCRRVLRHAQDAEDAFQAAFLVLVRKAAAIGQRELLGNWLYGVAYRTALDARATAARRRARERQVERMPESEADPPADDRHELRALLDRELSRLPDKYRAAVVLCDLEGRPRRDVARQLGIPAGTLSGRLTTARRLLARRLARHGVSLSAAALTGALASGTASAGVPPPLVAATVAAGQGTAGAVSARVAALAEGGLRTMLLNRPRLALAVVLAAGLLVGGAAVVMRTGDSGEAKVLNLDGRGRRLAWSPDGKTLAVVEIYEPLLFGRRGSALSLWDVEQGRLRQTVAVAGGGGLAFQQVAFSPDGSMLAATVAEEVVLPTMRRVQYVIMVWDAQTLALKRTLGNDSQFVGVAWSPNGRLLAGTDATHRRVQLWDAETGTLQRTLDTGKAGPWSMAFSPDGKTLVVGIQKGDGAGEVSLWDVATGDRRHTLTQVDFVTAVACSPDGRRVASSGGGDLVRIWDIATGELLVSLPGTKGGSRSVAFSADGRLVAAAGADGKVRLWDAHTGELTETLNGHGAEVHAVAFSPDGTTLASTGQDGTVRLWKSPARQAGVTPTPP
jgi:RNA polymerase sigma factor (sigma-70 family)